MERTPKEVVTLYKEVVDAVMEQIPADVFGKSRLLAAEDYRTIVASCMIAYNDQFKFKNSGNRGGNYNKPQGSDGYKGESTPSQRALIITLTEKIPGKEGTEIINQFLDNNNYTTIDQLTKSEASTLIDQLIPLSPKGKKSGK